MNGKEGLACVTPVEPDGGTVSVEPLANLPVLTDLVVDMAPFVQRFPAPAPDRSRRASSCPAPRPPTTSRPTIRFEDCIECGLCLSACPVAATDDTYVGPAALAYAQRMLEDDRGDREPLLDWADQDNAAWRCHAAFECTEACPSDVRPAQRIMALRKELRGRGKAIGRRCDDPIPATEEVRVNEPERAADASTRPGCRGDPARPARARPGRTQRAPDRSRGSTSDGEARVTSRSR